MEEFLRRPFDLETGPLMRAALYRLGAEEHLLFLPAHHLVFDGWSRGVLLKDLAASYEAVLDGSDPRLPELSFQFGDYAAWQVEELASGRYQEQLKYWKTRLAGAPAALDLPLFRSSLVEPGAPPLVSRMTLEPGLLEELEKLASAQGSTLFMLLLSGYALLLGRLGRVEDLVIGTPVAGRKSPHNGTQDLIGPFINTLPLRVDLAGAASFSDLLRRVRAVCLEAYANQDLPFEKLVEEINPQRSLNSLAHLPELCSTCTTRPR